MTSQPLYIHHEDYCLIITLLKIQVTHSGQIHVQDNETAIRTLLLKTLFAISAPHFQFLISVKNF